MIRPIPLSAAPLSALSISPQNSAIILAPPHLPDSPAPCATRPTKEVRMGRVNNGANANAVEGVIARFVA